mmetsp:Transcript_43130/g.99366  ORF Transcript_43130/g.99366 Transcript_43130/m.99366 type:complete len:522 (+) Transcript_43130:112-1677(+)
MKCQWWLWSSALLATVHICVGQNPWVDDGDGDEDGDDSRRRRSDEDRRRRSDEDRRRRRGSGSWNYREQPDWPDNYPTCGDAGVQSPIDLTQWDDSNSGDLTFHKPSADHIDVSLETNTWTRVVHWGTQTSEEASVTFNGVAYYLRNFTYRSPSENTVRGKYSDMEVQYQHESIGGNGLVLSVRMTCQGSDQNEFMQEFWHRFPDTTDERASASASNPYSQGTSKALPNDLSFWRWEGAWSNPPCTRHWVWVLFHDLVQCSSEQMRSFREDINKIPDNKLVVRSTPYGVSNNWEQSLGCNNRNLQSVGTRTVYFHSQSGSTSDDDDDDDHHHSKRFWYQRWWVWFLICLLYCCCAAACLGLAFSGALPGAGATDKKDKEPREEEQPLQEKPPKVLDMEYHPEEDDSAPYHVAKPKRHHHHQSHGSHQVQSVGDYTYVPTYVNDSRSSFMQQESLALPPSASFGQMYSTGGPPPHPQQAGYMSSMAAPSATAMPLQPRLPPTAGAPSSSRRLGGMDSLAFSG